MKSAVVILSTCLSFSSGITFTQTDWSGGPGTSGPVAQWGSSFSVSSNVYTEFERLQLQAGDIIQYPEMEIINNWWFQNAFDFPEATSGNYSHMVSLGPDSTLLFWENASGTGADWTIHTVGETDDEWLYSIVGFDPDGDGDIDIAAAGSDSLFFWENTGFGGSWPRFAIAGIYLDCPLLEAGDLNGDGIDDLMMTDISFDWFEFSGQNWIQHGISLECCGFGGINDIDSDGDLDIATYRKISTEYELLWLENQTPMEDLWAEHIVAENIPDLFDVIAADLNGDGSTDIISGQSWEYENESGGYIIWWENTDGTGTLFAPCTLSTEGAKDMVVSDLDLDGDLDIASLISFGEPWDEGYTVIQWLENNGGSQFTEHAIWESTEYCWLLCTRLLAADTDCDGAVELYTSLPGNNENAFIEFKLMGFQSMGWLESSILDAGDHMNWNLFQFSAYKQTGDQVSFQVRSSSNPDEMGPWSPSFTTESTSISGMVEDSSRYFQYRLDLEGGSPETSPVVYDVTVSCDYTGTGTFPADHFLIKPLSNPCHGLITLEVSTDIPRQISLKLVDISGRVLTTIDDTVTEGSSLLRFEELVPGVYFCHAESGGESKILRIMVID